MKTGWKWMIMALVLGAAAAQAAPKAALFVQNRAGSALDGDVDAFRDLMAARLSEDGFLIVNPADVLDRVSATGDPVAGEALRQDIQALQSAKAEGTVDEPAQSASALRLAQMLETDYLVFASLISLGENKKQVTAYGMTQDVAQQNLRVGLRVLEGSGGAQIYGDVIKVSDTVAQNPNLSVSQGDQLNELLDRGATELATAVSERIEQIEAGAPLEPDLASLTVQASAPGAVVELDGAVIGTSPGTFQVRKGVHRMRVSREGYAAWEKSVNITDGQVLNVVMEMSGTGIDRKGELEAQSRVDDIAREQSAADAQAKTAVAGGVAQQASNSFIRLEGMPNESLTIGSDGRDGDRINVIQQEVK